MDKPADNVGKLWNEPECTTLGVEPLNPIQQYRFTRALAILHAKQAALAAGLPAEQLILYTWEVRPPRLPEVPIPPHSLLARTLDGSLGPCRRCGIPTVDVDGRTHHADLEGNAGRRTCYAATRLWAGAGPDIGQLEQLARHVVASRDRRMPPPRLLP